MTNAEFTFKRIVNRLIDLGTYPGPTAINRQLGRTGKLNQLNGRETRWRREVMKERNIPLMRPHAAMPLTDYDGEWR